MATTGRKRHKWVIDFSQRGRTENRQILPVADLSAPVGYSSSIGQIAETASRETDTNLSSLIVKKSWDIALGPLKQIPMNLFIMFMAGNSISIFPIMMVGMMFLRPIKALISIQPTFKMIEGSQAGVQRFVYFIGNLAGVALALYKCQSMGLLPTYASDWLAFQEAQTRMEFSGGGMVL